MTDSMKFGPEWLRNMNSEPSPLVLGAGVGGGGGGSSTAVSSNSMSMNDTAPIIMAQFRYGREEMLLLFNSIQCNVPPDPLKNMQGLFVEKKQMPINLITLTEEETRMWNRGINSDAALRLAKPGAGPGVGVPGSRGALGGRGGSVDRGRGRARGSYHYSRGLSYEESDTSNGFNSRGIRNFDRTQSQGSWNERNGGDTADYTATSPRKEFGSRSLSDTNWRRHRSGGDEDDTWRNTRTEKWGRNNNNSWRESENWDRSNHNNNHMPQKKPWEGEENNLPEWATENPSESGGTFDSSGAFHGGSTYSDDDDGEGHPKSETAKNSTNGTSQPRPANQTKKEPPNIPNGTTSDSSSTSLTSLKQSQSASSLSSERRSITHPITTSASFSGVVDMHTSQSSRSSKPSRKEDEQQSKPSTPVTQQPPPTPVKKPAEVPVSAPPVVEPKAVTKTSQEEEIEQRLLDAADVFVSRLMDEEEKDPPNVQSSSATPPTNAATPAHTHTLNDSLWYYQDPQGNVQGPFQSSEMAEWFSSGYFKGTLLVRRACDERYSPLSELIKLWGGIPFILDYYQIPPIKNTEPVVPIIDEALLLQVQMQQQQRFLLQRAQALAKLTQSDHFNNLTVEQQQLLAHQAQMEISMQAGLMNPLARTQNQQPPAHPNANVVAMLHQLAQYQQHPQARTGPQVTLPVPSPAEPPPDPVLQLMQQMGLQTPTPRPSPSPTEPDQRSIEQFMNAFRQRQVNPHTMESVWGGTNTAPNFPGWTAPPGHSSLWVDPIAKGIKTEQEVLEEQLRAEEKKKEEIRKQEELQRIKDEEEIQRRIKEEEELERRRLEEEREKEKERKRIQEEEERKKKEAAAAKKAEQDRLRKEEEKKRKEEEKRRKEEEKRKQEEDKRRAEEEKRKLEEERKKREEITKRQKEALKQLQEQQQQQQARVVKPVPAPWTAPETAGASLADIQKTERKQQQQLREQQEMLKAYQEKHQQEQQLKNTKSLNLKWADPVGKNQPARVKSLAEIQAEEHERMAKQAEKEKAERIAAAKDIPTPVPGSIWASSQSLNWNSTSVGVWGTTPTAVSGSGAPRFWDEVSAKAAKPQQQAPSAASKSQTKTKAKKEEATVMKLFEKQLPKSSKSDEFNRWCSKTLASCNSTLDIPTFVDFLLAFESQKEVREYIHMYLGNTQEANNFASEFIERRARLFSPDQPLTRPEPPAPTNSHHFQEVKGKNKKMKKGKMTKVDNKILGFNVTAAPDRINVGDRDYGEGL